VTAAGVPLSVRIEGWSEPQVVDFPVDQPGASAMIGYWGRPTDAYVLKVLKVADLRAALRGRIREPGYVRLLRRLPLADSPFAPTRMARARIGRIHDLCRPWLRDVDRVRARALLACTVPELGTRRRDELLDTVFAERALLQLTPDISRLVDVDLPQLGPTAVPALCQRAVTGAPYRLPLGRGRHGDREIAFLVLLATARRLAQVHSLGLDLSCRFDRRDRCLVFPNVLAPAGEPGLAYVDFFGWATPLGNLAERTGFRIGYSERGPGRWLLRAMARRVTS
jgi:hypothetical protein